MTGRSPLVLLHGFMDGPRTWELVRPALERRHELLMPTLPGHAGAPPLAVPSVEGTVMAPSHDAETPARLAAAALSPSGTG